MKDCWQNAYATYKPDRETFYTKVKKVLDAINVIFLFFWRVMA